MLLRAREKLGNVRPKLRGISLDEDRTLFASVVESVVDKIQEHLFSRPVPENYVEDIDINMGCFKEFPSLLEEIRDLRGHLERMTKPMSIEACRRLCRRKRFTYAGAMRGEICLCGDERGRKRAISQSACSEPCGDREGMRCGGREAYSLYPACRFGHHGTDCKAGCFCVEFPCALSTGQCPGGFCRYGWTGSQCNARYTSWTSPDRLATIVVVYLVVYVVVVVTGVIFIAFAKYGNDDNPDYEWYLRRT